MKNNALLLALGFVAFAGAAQAQTCAGPSTLTFDGTSSTASGTTCGAANNFTQYCAGADNPEPEVVFRVTISDPHTATAFTLTPTGAAWNPALQQIAGGCDPNNTCTADADAGGSGAAETLNVPATNAQPYFFVVTASPQSTPTCGAFTLSANGTLPVSLQNFSVE